MQIDCSGKTFADDPFILLSTLNLSLIGLDGNHERLVLGYNRDIELRFCICEI